LTDKPIYHFGKEWKRSSMCGELRAEDEGREVRLAGWVRKVREFGELTFLDMWDRSGLVQLVIEAGDAELHTLFRSLRSEDVIAVRGAVRKRPSDMVNPSMGTGEVEVAVSAAEVFNRSKVPPFNVTDKSQASDEMR